MKFTLRVLGILLLLSCPLLYGQVEIVRIWPAYRTAESLTSIREYFGGDAANVVSQSQPSQSGSRAGYYWLVRAKSAEAIPSSSLILEVIREGAPEPEVHTFPVSIDVGSHAFQVGLTGTDWENLNEAPLAWRLTLLDAKGQTVSQATSYLWKDN